MTKAEPADSSSGPRQAPVFAPKNGDLRAGVTPTAGQGCVRKSTARQSLGLAFTIVPYLTLQLALPIWYDRFEQAVKNALE